MDEQPPYLPPYQAPGGIARISNPKQQSPLNKLLGKMLAAKLPKLMKMKGKVSPQTIKIGHKKKKQQTPYY